jgi:hypothetical protein
MLRTDSPGEYPKLGGYGTSVFDEIFLGSLTPSRSGGQAACAIADSRLCFYYYLKQCGKAYLYRFFYHTDTVSGQYCQVRKTST